MLTVCFVWVGTYEEIQCLGQAISRQNQETKEETLCILRINDQSSLFLYSFNIINNIHVSDSVLLLLTCGKSHFGVTV